MTSRHAFLFVDLVERRALYEMRFGATVGAVIGAFATYVAVTMTGCIGDLSAKIFVTALGALFEGAFVGGLSYVLVKRKLASHTNNLGRRRQPYPVSGAAARQLRPVELLCHSEVRSR
jgi:hypothetical protein